MPSTLHEVLIAIFRNRPSLAAELLEDAFGIEVPPHEQVRVEPSDFSDVAPTQYQADSVTVLSTDDQPVLAVVTEVQLGRDPDKRWSWPVYLATLRARLKCPAVLMVVCPQSTVAAWSARPIDLGHPGWTLTPLVLHPDRVPVVTDVDEAQRSPELAVLSAMAHGDHPESDKVLSAMLGGLKDVEQQRAVLYYDIVLHALPAAARSYLEGLIVTATYEFQSDFMRRHQAESRAEGQVHGEAVAVVRFLKARGIEMTDDEQARILAATNADQVNLWVERAATITSLEELFI
jgi:hypothetical protein